VLPIRFKIIPPIDFTDVSGSIIITTYHFYSTTVIIGNTSEAQYFIVHERQG